MELPRFALKGSNGYKNKKQNKIENENTNSFRNVKNEK